MRKLVYILNIALAFGFVACDRTGVDDPQGEEGGVISLVPQTVETRALINNVTDLRDYTLKVWDIWTGQTDPYIDNTLVYSSGSWQYGTTPASPYLWKSGTHKFYGYIDGTGTYDPSAKTLSVSKSLTASANEKDVLYSEVFSSTAADWMATKTPETPVPLHFKHLLSSIGIVVKNCTEGSVTLNSVSTVIPNKGSATVDFSGNQSEVEYGSVTADETTPFIPSENPIADVALPSQGFVDVLAKKVFTTGTADIDTSYFVIWPQTIDTLKIKVKYTITDGTDVVVYDKTVKVPNIEWVAGNKYTYTLNISATDILLTFVVQPWDSGEAGGIDTKNSSISMTNVTWMNTKVKLTENGEETNTVNIGGYSVNMYYHPYVQTGGQWVQYTANNGYFPAQGYFTISYPLNGKYKIGLIPAYGETEVDPSQYAFYIYDTSTGQWNTHNQTDGETITDKTVYFQVRATGADTASHKAQINIWIRSGDGEWVSAYSEIRSNYALVIPAR